MKKRDEIDLLEVRHYLHSHPELSGKEHNTALYIKRQLSDLAPESIISEIADSGIMAVFDSGSPGKCLVLRAELDALPIKEDSRLSYGSIYEGVSHKCGHDGHMVILLAVAEWLAMNLDHLQGKVVLLFQPAEETAGGAQAVLADQKFTDLKPDFMFALHNLPGFTLHSLILKPDVFAAASLGLKFWLQGRSTHAGHPENGNNPLPAMQALVNGLNALPHRLTAFNDPVIVTIIHMRLGEQAFGTSPGDGVVMATIRAASDERLQQMAKEAECIAEAEARAYKLGLHIERVEEFAATVNNEQAYGYLKRAAHKSGLAVIEQQQIFPWTEDFSFFSQKYKSAFFGLGCGINQPQLHNPDYDFPDDLVSSGKEIFIKIIKEVLSE